MMLGILFDSQSLYWLSWEKKEKKRKILCKSNIQSQKKWISPHELICNKKKKKPKQNKKKKTTRGDMSPNYSLW